MVKKVVTTHNQCDAFISINRNRIKKYGNNNYYLKNNQEFELTLVNYTKDVVMAKISMNGKTISNNYGLVLKPGQRVVLERYLDEASEFKFETYSVDNTPQAIKAIQNNGDIKVEFFKEESPKYYYTTSTVLNGWNCFQNTCYNRSSVTLDSSPQFNSCSVLRDIETGRVEKGSKSNQEFDNYSGEFQIYPFETVNIKLLPISNKPLYIKDLITYCTNCGTKNRKGNYKFCPKCGTKF